MAVNALHRIAQLIPGRSMMRSGPLAKLELFYEFEPHGRASETWEDVWLLTLPGIRQHYMTISGWMECRPADKSEPDATVFKGHLSEVVAYAINFLEWYRGSLHFDKTSADDGAMGG